VTGREKSIQTVHSITVDGKRDADCKSAVQQIENLRHHPAAGDAQRRSMDVRRGLPAQQTDGNIVVEKEKRGFHLIDMKKGLVNTGTLYES